ncbi:formin-like protein 4 [Dendrobium catenatum]|uniref:Formin-like protein n=1 Tax=Dendrobium catenatum TaxID=906689 RepID=A0A2I0VV36_9ASPA|nr:formin-like protein 4 [Dendrobium catenatum]PKU67275.1 Formin-like protein 8 [Dendrobium catenatum]
MDSIARLGFTLSLLILLIQSLFPYSISSLSQRHLLQLSSRSPQNLQTFPSTAIPAFTHPPPTPPPPPLSSPPPPLPPPASSASDLDNGSIAAAVIGTAASSFAIYGFLFFAFYRFTKKKRRGPETRVYNSDAAAGGSDVKPFRSKPEPTLKGLIVDENGLDVLYWQNLEDRRRCHHCNSIVERGRHMEDDEPPEPRRRRRGKGELMTQESPLLPTDSVNSSSMMFAQSRVSNRISSASMSSPEAASHSPPAVPPPAKSQPPPPPPPPPAPPKPPTPLAPPIKNAPAPPPPPSRRAAAAPTLQLGPDGGTERPRLKPLHWEKVTPTRAGHSMVWDRINDGSIKFDDDQIEALFGYVSANPNPAKSNSSESSSSTSTSAAAAVPTPINLLDARKSQNIAIILRTIAVSRNEILDSLQHGHGLAADTLEKLTRITLTKDEESLILSFSGNPVHLTDAESFLFHLLQSFPSAFPRLNAMHFRSCVYNTEILHLKQSLQTLELACKELRTRGLFLKLLEAILKAGNRMNAGTARGNAQAFDLTALRKLSDVKSTDGKTTLLHFVVEEVVRSEGKRCAAINAEAGEDREREFMMLGLPVVGGLSSEFMNVKKAAALDLDSMAVTCSAMAERVMDIRKFLRSCEENEEGFVREMKGFVETASKEIEEVREEQWKVMEIVKRTTDYYLLGAAMKEKEGKPSLQILVIVRDFLAMVDQACIDICRNIQKRKKETPLEKEKRMTTRFPNLPARFMADNSVSCSDSEEEF